MKHQDIFILPILVLKNNLLQKDLLIGALYTHLIEEGGEESGKET